MHIRPGFLQVHIQFEQGINTSWSFHFILSLESVNSGKEFDAEVELLKRFIYLW